MDDPFAPSNDPDIPTPSREDLLPHVHGSVRDQLAAGTLDAKHAQNEWIGARRRWDEEHRARTARKAHEMERPQPSAPSDPKSAGIRLPTTGAGQTEQERIRTQLLSFMSPQVRASFHAADRRQKAVIWEANRRAFEAAQIREEQRLVRETERTAKIFDMLQRLREDPSKSHLLPPENASMEELSNWFDEMSRPVRNIPFSNPTEQHIRRERMWKDIQRTGKADPEDIAEEEGEAERYRRKLAEARKRKLKNVEVEFAQAEKANAGAGPDPNPLYSHGDPTKVGSSRDLDRVVAENPEIAVAGHNQVVITSGDSQGSQSLWDKFWKLAESNFFMGGGIGVAIAAYAFLLSGAPRFGFALLVLSWLVISVSVWKHRFFENRAYETVWQAVTCGLIGIVLLGTWISLV